MTTPTGACRLTLPNGVNVSCGYDNGCRLTAIRINLAQIPWAILPIGTISLGGVFR